MLNNAEAVGKFGTKMPTAVAVCRIVLVCREPVSRVVDGIKILNFRDFIDRLWSDQLNLV